MTSRTVPCKICHQPVTVVVDDEYEEVGDYLKLLPMSCHDACYDLHTRLIKLHDAFGRATNTINILTTKERETEKEVYKGILRVLTQKYAAWWRDKSDQSNIIWDQELVDMIWDNPRMWPEILTNYRRHAKMLWGPPITTSPEPQVRPELLL